MGRYLDDSYMQSSVSERHTQDIAFDHINTKIVTRRHNEAIRNYVATENVHAGTPSRTPFASLYRALD